MYISMYISMYIHLFYCHKIIDKTLDVSDGTLSIRQTTTALRRFATPRCPELGSPSSESQLGCPKIRWL